MNTKSSQSIKALIFDFGGVIFPVEPYSGGETMPEERKEITGTIQNIFKSHNQEILHGKYTIEQFKTEFTHQAKHISPQRKAIVIKSVCEPDPGLLHWLHEQHSRFSLFGLVNAPLGWTEIRRGLHGLDTLFNRVVVSHEINVRKPDREIFEHLLKEIPFDPTECIFIDDKQENLDTAASLGLRVNLYQNLDSLKEMVEP